MSEDEILKKIDELEKKLGSSQNLEERIQSLRDYRNYLGGVVDTFQGPSRNFGRMSLSILTAMELIDINRIELNKKLANIDERLNKIETMFGKLEKHK